MSSEETRVAVSHPAVQELMKQYPQAHLLLPSQTFLQNLGAMQKVSVEAVQLDGSPGSKDAYPIPGQEGIECTCQKDPHTAACRLWNQKVALHAAALERMAMAAAISYHPDSCYTVDDRERKAYKALAMMRKADGSWRVEPFEKAMDLNTLERKFRAQYQRKVRQAKAFYKKKNWNWPGDEEWVEEKVQRDLLQKEEYLRELVQTGAKKRAVQHYLGLPAHFTRRQLQEPFIAIRIDFSPDLNDPESKRFLLEQGSAAAAQIYPSMPGKGMDITHSAQVTTQPEPPPEDEMDYEGLLAGDQEDPREARIMDIETMTPDEMQAHFISLMKKIRYNILEDPQRIGAMWKEGKKADAVYEMEQLVETESGDQQ